MVSVSLSHRTWGTDQKTKEEVITESARSEDIKFLLLSIHSYADYPDHRPPRVQGCWPCHRPPGSMSRSLEKVLFVADGLSWPVIGQQEVFIFTGEAEFEVPQGSSSTQVRPGRHDRQYDVGRDQTALIVWVHKWLYGERERKKVPIQRCNNSVSHDALVIRVSQLLVSVALLWVTITVHEGNKEIHLCMCSEFNENFENYI